MATLQARLWDRTDALFERPMTLDTLLAELRAELKAETPSVLHSHAAPTLRDSEGLTVETDQGGIGMPFTAAMHRYLAHPDHWGLSRLGMLSIIEVSEACCSKHPQHRRPLFTRSLCGDLLFKAAYLGQTVDDLAWLTGMEPRQIHGMLLWGARHAAEWRGNKFAQWSKVPGEDAPLPERRPFRPAA